MCRHLVSCKFLGLALCCGQVLYFLATGGGGYFTGSFSDLVGSAIEKDQLPLATQRAAYTALAKLLHQEAAAFDTAYSTRESVLKNGFPLTWKQCTLQPLLPVQLLRSDSEEEDDQRDPPLDKGHAGVDFPPPEPLHVVVLGGSSSAHSGKNCSYESHILPAGDPYAGRYSNILMHELYEDFFSMEGEDILEFDVANRAQGATDTVWNALLLDELLELHADVLIVEYGINDALGGTTKHPYRTDRHLEQMMNLWLWRVYSLFRSAHKQRSPPPILFVFLWDANFYKPAKARDGTFDVNTDHLIHQGIGQTSWKAQQRVLEHYRQLGWRIGAINVGAVIDNVAVAKDPYVLLDDKHHPNCGSMHLISAMIRHAIYTDLIHCPTTNPGYLAQPAAIRPMKFSHRDEPGGLPSELLQLLLSDNVKVGSLMNWEPNIGRTSLSLGPDRDFFNASRRDHIEPDHGTKSYPWRADRKQSFTLPRCDSADEPIHFTLLEPGLQWVGVGFKILPLNDDDDATVAIEMTINSIPFLLSEPEETTSNNGDGQPVDDDTIKVNHTVLEFDEAFIIKDWFKLADHLPQPPAPDYRLSFCYITQYPTIPVKLPQWEDCPYKDATSISEVCDLWSQENFDRMVFCPYAHYSTIDDVCFQWHEEALQKAEGELDNTKHQPKEPADFLPPQLNWVVGLIAD